MHLLLSHSNYLIFLTIVLTFCNSLGALYVKWIGEGKPHRSLQAEWDKSSNSWCYWNYRCFLLFDFSFLFLCDMYLLEEAFHGPPVFWGPKASIWGWLLFQRVASFLMLGWYLPFAFMETGESRAFPGSFNRHFPWFFLWLQINNHLILLCLYKLYCFVFKFLWH